MPEKKPHKGDHIYLIDGSGYIFRAYYAQTGRFNPFLPDGTRVNAVFIFSNMLNKLLNDLEEGEKPSHLLVVFDAGRKTFRNEIFPEYKAHRPDPPEDLIPQFPLIREAVEAFNVPCIEMKGYEADDIIATYAKQATDQGLKVSIVSSDKDLMQLVSDKVELFDAMKNKHIGVKEVREKFGVRPDQVIDVQSLTGDKADNVPGVPGIGEKAASLLIKEYETLDHLLNLAKDPEVLRVDLISRQEKTEEKIYKLAGHPFKIGSKKELGVVLFEELELPGGKKDKKGENYITTNEVLENLEREGFKIAKRILSFRQISRLTGNLCEILSENIELAKLSRRLVTLKQDVPLDQGVDDFKVREIDPEVLYPFLDAMEFKTLKAKAISRLGALEGDKDPALEATRVKRNG